MKKLNNNVYIIDLPKNFGIGSINVEDLVDYKGLNFNPLVNEPSSEPIFEMRAPPFLHSQIILPNTADKVDKMMIIATKDDGTRRYLVYWKRKAPTDDMWIDQSDL